MTHVSTPVRKGLYATTYLVLLFIAMISLPARSSAVGTWNVPENKTVTVHYSSQNVQVGRCTGSDGLNGWAGAKNEGGDWPLGISLKTLSLNTPYLFTYTCFSDPGSVYLGAPVTDFSYLVVIPSQQVSVSFSPQGQANPLDFTPLLALSSNRTYTNHVAGTDSVTISWNYSDRYASCTASGAWTGARAVIGSQTFANDFRLSGESEIRTFSLSCTSRNGKNSSASVSVTFEGPPLCAKCSID